MDLCSRGSGGTAEALFYNPHLMQDLECIAVEVLWEGANQIISRGCGGCNLLEGIDCYALKCTEITLFAKISVL